MTESCAAPELRYGSAWHGIGMPHISLPAQLHVVVLCLNLIVRVLMGAKNNGTQGTRGFRQVQDSMTIKTLRHV
jgi:hypothetical protein